MTNHRLLLGVGFGVLFLASACASLPPPQAQLTQSKSALSAAEAVGASSVPRAALHLKMSKDQIQTAEALIADGEMNQAELVLRRAEADAELALFLARDASTQAQAIEAKKKLEKLKSEQ
ncbi:MAG: DUF4398 domain-containing protein [Polyangiaceae bacterium]|nr:DUF4398 domain-containing protein [Polyangiaceae bacterium]